MTAAMTIVLNTSLSGFLESSQNSESEPGQDVPANEMSFTKLMDTFTHGDDSSTTQPETSPQKDMTKLAEGALIQPSLNDHLKASEILADDSVIPTPNTPALKRSDVDNLQLPVAVSPNKTEIDGAPNLERNISPLEYVPEILQAPDRLPNSVEPLFIPSETYNRVHRPDLEHVIKIGGFIAPHALETNQTATNANTVLIGEASNSQTGESLIIEEGASVNTRPTLSISSSIILQAETTPRNNRSPIQASTRLEIPESGKILTPKSELHVTAKEQQAPTSDAPLKIIDLPFQSQKSTHIPQVLNHEPSGNASHDLSKPSIEPVAPAKPSLTTNRLISDFQRGQSYIVELESARIPVPDDTPHNLKNNTTQKNGFEPSINSTLKHTPDFSQSQRLQIARQSDLNIIQDLQTPKLTNAQINKTEATSVKNLPPSTQTETKSPVPKLEVQSSIITPVVETNTTNQIAKAEIIDKNVRAAYNADGSKVAQSSHPLQSSKKTPLTQLVEDKTISLIGVRTANENELETSGKASQRDTIHTPPALDKSTFEGLKTNIDKIEFKVPTAPGLMTSDVAKPVAEPLPQLFSVSPTPMDSLSKPSIVVNSGLTNLAHSAQPQALQTVGQNLIQAIVSQSSVSVRLDPPEMGNVSISFQFDAERGVTAIVRSELVETSIFLKERAEILQQTLKDSGFDSVDLSFEHGQSASHSQDHFEQGFQSSDTAFGAYDMSDDLNAINIINYTRNYGIDDQIDLRL